MTAILPFVFFLLGICEIQAKYPLDSWAKIEHVTGHTTLKIWEKWTVLLSNA